MDDVRIVELFFARSQDALKETKDKYEKTALIIAERVLHSDRDAEECVSDAYLALWNNIPPESPRSLSAYFYTIVRNLALKRYRQKKDAAEVPLEEIEEILPSGVTVDDEFDQKELTRLLERWLRARNKKDLYIFLHRYWYFEGVDEIASALRMKKGTVYHRLNRLKDDLYAYLVQNGVFS